MWPFDGLRKRAIHRAGKPLRAIAVLAIVMLTAMLSAPCVTETAPGSPVQLDFWSSSNPQEIEFARAVVNAWNASRSNVKVKLQPLPASRSSEEVLLASIAARSTPDIVANIYPGAVSQFVESRGLYPVDSFPDFLSFIEDRLPPGVLEQFRSSDGRYYQVPWKSNPIMLAYNVNMLKAAGVDPSSLATYSGFLDSAERLVRSTRKDRRTDRWMISLNIEPIWWQRFFDFYTLYIAASGGRTLISDNRATFNDSAGVKVMQFLADLFGRGYAPKSTFAGDVFLQGKVATVITGPWAIPYYEAMKPRDFVYDFTHVPVPDDYKGKVVYTYGDPKNIGIFTTSKHPAEAWEFVKFIISAENDARFMDMTSQIPYRRNLENDPRFAAIIKKQPLIARFVEQSHNTRGVDSVGRIIEVFDAIAQEYQYCAVLGGESAREAVDTAAERVSEILRGAY